MSEFLLKRGSMQDRFLQAKSKIQILGGGFGNGKTTAAVHKALRLAKLYPGSNGLIARATFPKLNDTVRKEFLKWCPQTAIASFPMSANASNTCTLKNGTTINFRYIAQQGKSNEQSTSNLLSATYDWILVDQIEDPEIVEKDYYDLLGRLRGNTPANFDASEVDPLLGPLYDMPRTGPRWFMITLNPTAGWPYRTLIKPLHVYQATGTVDDKLMCVRDSQTRQPKLIDGRPQLLIELYEGSTYENKHVYEALGSTDFLEMLESSYQGQMRDRFLLGKWAAYEGLIYSMFNEVVHCIPQAQIAEYLQTLLEQGVAPLFIEGYDFGIASPSCYGLALCDNQGNTIIVDGFYEKELSVDAQARRIKDIRAKWVPSGTRLPLIYADPSVMRRAGGAAKTVGKTIADLFREQGIGMQAGNNDILNGILKVQGYLDPRPLHKHPITGVPGYPYLYHATELQWITDEYLSYMWGSDNAGNRVDSPANKQADHAMDMVKYLLSHRPPIARLVGARVRKEPDYLSWHEQDVETNKRNHRYG
jgi:hypothetical protein